jgi:outer membrane protein OmpA-like peptidoglycan-associated protein
MVSSGCSGASKGAGIGGAIGAAAGAVIGNQGNKTGTGAVAGGAVGAAVGAIIGDYMSKQKQELEQIPAAQVVQEGDELKVQFENAILFDLNSYALKPTSKDDLRRVAGVLVKYPDTQLVVGGHTDNTGSDDYNQKLSDQRAYAVKDFLVENGVGRERVEARGFGEGRPTASNETAQGREQNRRVEIQIAANQALRARAAEQAQGR